MLTACRRKDLRDCRNPAVLDLYWQVRSKDNNLSEPRNPYLTAAYIHEGRHSQHKRLKGR